MRGSTEFERNVYFYEWSHVLVMNEFLFMEIPVYLCPLSVVLKSVNKFLLLILIQVFDASTNKWKLVDEKQHTDVYERIVENPIEITDVQYRRNITDETNIINNLERNLLQEKFDEKHSRTTDSVDYIRSDHLIDESVSSSDLVNQVVIKEDVKSRKDTKVCHFHLTI